MATAKILSDAMRNDTKLIKNIGEVWTRTNLYFKDSDDAHTLREVELFLGCLKSNWNVNQPYNVETFDQSCSVGTFTVPTSKPWQFSVDTRNLPPALIAAYTGMKIEEYYAGTTTEIRVVETVTATAAAFATSGDGINLADAISGLVYGDVNHIISVKRKGTTEWWTEAAAAADASLNFQWVDGDDVTYGEGANAPLLLFEDTDYNGDEFVIKVDYNRTIEAGEFKLTDDGATFPANFDIYVSWFRTVMTGADKGKKGVVTAKLLNMERTGEFALGGDAQQTNSSTFEFSQNFSEDGDTEFSFAWLT